MAQPMISVVIPVYKVEAYLKKCVDSVIAQSYENIEIILVDDCSPDNCPAMCDEYEKADKRIRVIHHSENGGLSCARNSGIEAARGEYIAFVDSDDYINKFMLETLYREISENDCGIAVCGLKYVFENDSIDTSKAEPSGERLILSGTEAVKKLFSDKHSEYVVSCNKLYKRKLFDSIKFPCGKIHEDTFTTYKLFFESERVVYNDVKLYYYLQRRSSIMHSGDITLMYAIEAMDEFGEYCEKNIDDAELLNDFIGMKNIMKANFALDAYYFSRKNKLVDEKNKFEKIYNDIKSSLPYKTIKFRLFETNKFLFAAAFRVYVIMHEKPLD